MQPRKPVLARFQKTALRLLGLSAVFILVLMGSSCSNAPKSPIVFGALAVPSPTNTSLICVTLTNRSYCAVCYLAEPLEVRSNGIWRGPTLPPGQRLTKLLPGQSGVVVVDAALTNENARVPMLWGYEYNASATKWGQLREEFASRIRGHGGNGLLHTNFFLSKVRL